MTNSRGNKHLERILYIQIFTKYSINYTVSKSISISKEDKKIF